jgi:predicted phosphodiesterase
VTGAAAGAPQSPIANGPYLQHLSSTSVDIRLELDRPATPTVDLEGTDAAPNRKWTSVAGTFHSFHLDGLLPATHYRYTVHIGALVAPGGDFVTAPRDDSRAPFAFVVYGDTRTNDDAHARIVAAIEQQSFDFLVNTGDFVAAGGDRSLWRAFFSIENDLLRSHCVFACVGNHELIDDQAAANFLAYFGPNEASTVPYGSFRWGDARFFLLNAFQDWGAGELAWLQRELDKADAEPNLAWRFVVVHHSPWSSGRHGNDVKMLAAGVPELLARHGVDLVLSGHDHIYERGEAQGLKYVISGGGGAPLYPEMSGAPSTRHFESTFNFVRIAVEGDRLRTVAKRPDGSAIETCGFQHGQSWDCDPKPSLSASPAPSPPSSPPSANDANGTAARCACRAPGSRPTDDAVPEAALAALALLAIVTRRSGGGSRPVE